VLVSIEESLGMRVLSMFVFFFVVVAVRLRHSHPRVAAGQLGVDAGGAVAGRLGRVLIVGGRLLLVAPHVTRSRRQLLVGVLLLLVLPVLLLLAVHLRVQRLARFGLRKVRENGD
jgi:hypothetical protein